jgi:hypothetical protein
MSLRTIAKNVRPTWSFVREDLKDFVRHRFDSSREEMLDKEKQCLTELRRDGFTIISEFLSRDKALELRDRLEAHVKDGRNKDFDNGAYLRSNEGNAFDGGVRRIYHAEKLIKELADFRFNDFVFKLAKAYYGFPMHSGVLVYQHNVLSQTDTRYYHVDWFGKQFKSFLYLDDVDKGNGPFTYLRGSHRSHFLRLKKQILGNKNGSATSFSEDDVRSILHEQVQICGKAGTLIVADVRGLHRGSPQINRTRSIVVNYMYKTPGDIYMDR